jgi:hypothetical protein
MNALRCVLSAVFAISWALWFGGLCALLLFVLAMFDVDRLVGATTAPKMFRVFLVYSSIVAFAACASLLLLTWMVPTRRSVIMLVCTVLAMGTIGWTGYYIRAMDVLRMQGQGQTHEFRRLHAQSHAPYLIQIGLLFAVGVMLPGSSAQPGSSTSSRG